MGTRVSQHPVSCAEEWVQCQCHPQRKTSIMSQLCVRDRHAALCCVVHFWADTNTTRLTLIRPCDSCTYVISVPSCFPPLSFPQARPMLRKPRKSGSCFHAGACLVISWFHSNPIVPQWVRRHIWGWVYADLAAACSIFRAHFWVRAAPVFLQLWPTLVVNVSYKPQDHCDSLWYSARRQTVKDQDIFHITAVSTSHSSSI